jgi:hypothetical protein
MGALATVSAATAVDSAFLQHLSVPLCAALLQVSGCTSIRQLTCSLQPDRRSLQPHYRSPETAIYPARACESHLGVGSVGNRLGVKVGAGVGDAVGAGVGMDVGTCVGVSVELGVKVGAGVGVDVGAGVGVHHAELSVGHALWKVAPHAK